MQVIRKLKRKYYLQKAGYEKALEDARNDVERTEISRKLARPDLEIDAMNHDDAIDARDDSTVQRHGDADSGRIVRHPGQRRGGADRS